MFAEAEQFDPMAASVAQGPRLEVDRLRMVFDSASFEDPQPRQDIGQSARLVLVGDSLAHDVRHRQPLAA